jgi:putative membrane protein
MNAKSIGRFLLHTLISALAVFITAKILPGIHINNFLTSALVALALGLINNFIKPILIFLTIPVTVFTFGIFLLVINAGIIMLVAHFVPGFKVDGFWWALLFSIILSIITGILEIPVKKKKEEENR